MATRANIYIVDSGFFNVQDFFEEKNYLKKFSRHWDGYTEVTLADLKEVAVYCDIHDSWDIETITKLLMEKKDKYEGKNIYREDDEEYGAEFVYIFNLRYRTLKWCEISFKIADF